jgi:transposase InsO family protein
MAIKNKPKQQKVLLHSDQESTYRAYEYLKLFKANSITQSMTLTSQQPYENINQ